VVTLDDLVEEIISDAVPQAERSLYIEALGEGEVLASGRARLDDLGELLGVEWAVEGIDTIGGLIFNRLGALPKTGARVELEGAIAVVRRTSHKRVEEVLLQITQDQNMGVGENSPENGEIPEPRGKA
jgi:CBS domain containing-hemolysin-like protein